MVQQGGRPFIIGVLVSLPPLVALFVMQGVCHHADRTGEHARHLLWSMTAIAVGWVTVVVVQMPAAKLLGLVISSCGCYSSMALFWATAVQVIPRRSQAVGIGFVSTVATVATFVTPLVIGVLRDHTHDFYAGIWYLAALIVVGIGMLMSVSGNARRMATSQ